MSLGPLYVFLGEVSVQVLCLFFYRVVCLPGVQLCEFFIYFGDQALVWGIIGKYVFPYCWFSFHFNAVFFSHAEAFYFDEVPISKWVDQKTMVHLHNGILHSRRKKELIPFATTWMELESIMLSEIRHSCSLGEILWFLILGWLFQSRHSLWTKSTVFLGKFAGLLNCATQCTHCTFQLWLTTHVFYFQL